MSVIAMPSVKTRREYGDICFFLQHQSTGQTRVQYVVRHGTGFEPKTRSMRKKRLPTHLGESVLRPTLESELRQTFGSEVRQTLL